LEKKIRGIKKGSMYDWGLASKKRLVRERLGSLGIFNGNEWVCLQVQEEERACWQSDTPD